MVNILPKRLNSDHNPIAVSVKKNPQLVDNFVKISHPAIKKKFQIIKTHEKM